MRKVLNTLYILSPESYLSLDGENVVIQEGNTEKGRFPLHTLEMILSFSYKGASPALMGNCAKRGVGLCFFTPNGKFLARVTGEERGNVLLRKAQYRFSDDPFASCRAAKGFILGKLYNSRWSLERATRDHPLRVDVPALKEASASLAGLCRDVTQCDNLESLRGLEGAAATLYFGVLDQLILQNKEDFFFRERSRRPPLDRFNALLSFVYTLLANDCAAALEGVGLDAYVGFLHRDRPGRTSLALDLMEELRVPLADRFVLSLINTRTIRPKDFSLQENGAVLLSDEARRGVLSAWQQRKKETITHPFLGEKLPWGLVCHIQALLLARYLRGDLEEYPPFFWK